MYTISQIIEYLDFLFFHVLSSCSCSRVCLRVWMVTDVPDWFNERFVPKKSTIARLNTGSWHTLIVNRSEEQNQKLPPLMFSHRLCLSRRRFLRSSVNTLGFR